MQDTSFDFETLSLRPDAAILSLGAVRFDRNTGELGPEFYRVVEIEGHIDPSTLMWWSNQSEAARKAVFGYEVDRVTLSEALRDFADFTADALWLWSRGGKDAEWLENACARTGVAPVAKFWQFCDQRTVTNLFSHLNFPETEGTAHNALADAKRQATHLCQVFSHLRATGAA